MMRTLLTSSILIAVVACASCGAASGAGSGSASGQKSHREYRTRGSAHVECRGPANLSSALVEGRLDDLRASCRNGESKSCRSLSEQDPQRESDMELARASLRTICERDRAASRRSPSDFGLDNDRTCSCGQYGIVLMSDIKQRFDHEGLELVDEACVHGFYDACDLAQLASDICVYKRLPICTELRAQGRVRKPSSEEGADAVSLPPALLGCFLVDKEIPCTNENERESSGSDSSSGGTGACRSPHHEIGTVLCIEQDRISTKKPKGAPWDQVRASWVGFAGVEMFWSRPDRMHLRIESGGVVMLGPERLVRASEGALRESRALPHVEDVCKRSRRCIEAFKQSKLPPAKRRPPPPPQTDASGELEGPTVLGGIAEIDGVGGDTLIHCLAQEQFARAAAKPPLPECQ